MKIIFKNARLIPYLTDDYTQDRADVFVEDGCIRRIVPVGTALPDADVFDVNGRTLLPGMFDLHMHLYFFTSDFNKLAIDSANPVNAALHAIESAHEHLSQGFTTVRDCGNQYDIGLFIKAGVEKGLIVGPRVLTTGRIISPTARGNDTFPSLYAIADTSEELVKLCRSESAKGIDFLKYMGTGSVGNVSGIPGALITTLEEMATVQRVAEAQGTYVAVHCHGKQGILLCAQLGIRTIEHASDIDEECTELILRNGNKSAIVPTLGPIGLMQEGLLADAVAKKISPIERTQSLHPMVGASRAGVLTGWGTDVSLDYYTSHVGSEFLLRQLRGYTCEEMLKQATINSAKILGLDKQLGTIAEGKLADLLVVDGNPDEDIFVMTKRPDAVYKEGVRYF
jgi:imidazolonepropionase-like amidohydrolase